jgi:hypothetical protein
MPAQIPKAALGLYFSGVGLESLLDDLIGVGFQNEDVCAILPQTHSAARTLLLSKSRLGVTDDTPEIESVSHWFSQFGAVIIPGVGAFVSGREFVTILFGSGDGEMACDHALQGLGLPSGQIERLHGWVRNGGVIVYVCCRSEEAVHHAIETLEEAGAEEVSRLDAFGPERKLNVVPLLKAS